MLNKKKASEPSDLVLLQQGDDLDTLLDGSMAGSSTTVQEEQHENEMGAVDDLMKKYDTEEKNTKQNEDFVKVLKKDDKLLNFFIENY